MSHGLIPQDVISQIKERVDIADVVSDHVTLSKTGQNFKGLCPFHHEKTPSFTVSQSKQIFYCFGCHEGGNVFAFLMKKEGMTFPEAVRELGRRAGVAIPVSSDSRLSQESGVRERLVKLNESAAAWFHRNLLDPHLGKEAMTYLTGRGIARETIEAFGLGLSLPAWDGLIKGLTKEGYQPEELASAGLVKRKDQSNSRQQDAAGYYDQFRDRVMFPIRDLRKQVIGFGGRVLGDGMPKYLNSPDTPLFSKGRLLYGLERAREAANDHAVAMLDRLDAADGCLREHLHVDSLPRKCLSELVDAYSKSQARDGEWNKDRRAEPVQGVRVHFRAAVVTA